LPRTVLVAESNAYLLEMLSGILSANGFEVVGETSQPSEVAALAEAHKPDLLIYDFNLSDGGMAGLSNLQNAKTSQLQMKILVLGFQDATREFVAAVVSSGCDAFCNKFESQAGLLKTLGNLVA